MVAVGEYRQRKRTPAARHAYVPIERDIRRLEWPWRELAELCEGRYVNPAGYKLRMRRVVDLILGQCRHGRVVQPGRGVHQRTEPVPAGHTRVPQCCH